MKRRPWRSQTKSVSSQPASPCSLAGAMSRLATSTNTRSANGTPLACPRYWSRMDQRPNWSKQGAEDEDRSPGGGIEDVGIGSLGDGGSRGSIAAQESLELGEDFGEEVLATQVGDGALLDLAVLAIGFDDADVFVDHAVGGPDFDGAEVHAVKYHDKISE